MTRRKFASMLLIGAAQLKKLRGNLNSEVKTLHSN